MMEPDRDEFNTTKEIVRNESSCTRRQEFLQRFRKKETTKADTDDDLAINRPIREDVGAEDTPNDNDVHTRLLENEVHDAFKTLTTMNNANQMFFSSILPLLHDMDSVYQPLLHFPVGSPDVSELCCSCGRLSRLCCCFTHDATLQVPEATHDEVDIFNGDIDSHHYNDPTSSSSSQESDIESFVASNMKHRHANPRELMQDGIYVDKKPYLADLLLRGEAISLSLGLWKSSSHHLHLSRATQRTLRELKHSIEREKIRQLWMNMMSSEDNMKSNRILSPSSLLQHHPSGPILNIMSDPIDYRAIQPAIPEPDISFGGMLGNWDENTPDNVRLGNYIPKGMQATEKRAMIRFHLHQMNILDHPLMIHEERARIELERIFIQYRAILEEHVFIYLIYRIDALITELSRLLPLVSNHMTQAQDDHVDGIDDVIREEVNMLKMLITDVIDSISALADAFTTFTTLSKSVYSHWKAIQSIRQQQGFISTKIQLVAKRVKNDVNMKKDEVVAKKKESSTSVHSKKKMMMASFSAAAAASMDKPSYDIENELINEDKDTPTLRYEDLEKWRQLQSQLPSLMLLYQDIQVIVEQHRLSTIVFDINNQDPMLLSSTSNILASPKLSSSSSTIIDRSTFLSQTITTLQSYNNLYPDVIFQLSDDVDVTPDSQVSVEEAQRRKTWQYYTWILAISFDHHRVTITRPCKVEAFPYHLPLQQSFDILVAHAPSCMVVDIYAAMTTSYRINITALTPLASISIPTISLHETRTVSHASTPIVGWFTAMSAEMISRPSATIMDWLFSPPDPHIAARFIAALLCSIEYNVSATSSLNMNEGVHPHDVAIIPDYASTHQHHTSTPSSSFSRERDFQALLPDVLLLDPNDPKNDRLLYTKLQGCQRLLDKDVFMLSNSKDIAYPYHEHGLYYDNYMKMQMSSRLQLLSIRYRKPFLFTEPIPLGDDMIVANEVYKDILSKEAPTPDLLALLPSPTLTNTAMMASTISLSRSASTSLSTTGQHPGIISDDASSASDYPDVTIKHKVNDFIQRVRNSRVASDRNIHRKAISTSSVVAEKDYLNIFAGSDNRTNSIIPARKRALKPTPRLRTPMAQQVQSCNILIQVVGARNIPLREDHVDDGHSSNSPTAAASRSMSLSTTGIAAAASGIGMMPSMRRGYDTSLRSSLMRGNQPTSSPSPLPITEEISPLMDDVFLDENKIRDQHRARTFVEVRFQDHVFTTTTCEGATPIWKQLLSIPFHPEDDNFTPANLLQVDEDVIFTLFDEDYNDDVDKTGFLEGESTDRIDKRFLGRFAVPFTTIYRTGRVEGLFRLDTPCFNFGYNHERSRMISSQPTHHDTDVLVNNAYNSSLWTSVFNCDCFGISSSNSSLPVVDANQDLSHTAASNIMLDQDIEAELSYFSASDHRASFIKVLITLDPFLVSPPTSSSLDRYEIILHNVIPQDRIHVPYARRWLNSLKRLSPSSSLSTATATSAILSRSYQIMVTNSDGQDVLLCRYLTPQRPPIGYHSRRACINLVSMIPFLADSLSFSSDVDLWCTAKQMWDIGAGDEEEHAVQLYNYLYYLTHYAGNNQDNNINIQHDSVGGRSSSRVNNNGAAMVMAYPSSERIQSESVYLVQGHGIPEGDTVYIIIRVHQHLSPPQLYEAKNYLVINPNTGHCYSAADSSCPLKAIYVIATPYNIWANIQAGDHPKHISYDLQQPKLWRSFFHPTTYPYPEFGLHTVQEDVEYIETNRSYAIEVENTIKEAIRVNFRRWRSKRLRSSTTFHPDACAVVTDSLTKLDTWKRTGSFNINDERNNSNNTRSRGRNDEEDTPPPLPPSSSQSILAAFEQEIKSKLRTVLRTRVLHGFPINFPYTDIDSIIEEIKSYCIHEIKHPEVQFVLGVRAIPIVNNMISLWIYIGTLETTATPSNPYQNQYASTATSRYPSMR